MDSGMESVTEQSEAQEEGLSGDDEQPKLSNDESPIVSSFEDLLKLDLSSLPKPLSPDKCPLFCCFYAEFDNKVGPKVCFQSPLDFMNQDIEIATKDIHRSLERAFRQDESNDDSTPSTRNRKQPDACGDGEDETHSIFDSTSEYIITGSELAGKMINLSTHDIHILTRPTVIYDQRYERNSLLFCVGFVLRRAEDPRPYRPVLSKWAAALRSLELEYQALSHPTRRPMLQAMLNGLLISLNSSGECNFLLNDSNALNLKVFRPPSPAASPVPDHAVPVLLRRDWQVQMGKFDWDLAINWVVLHIDGVNTAKSISLKSEVDPEMVRACLRVLKHHGVIALVDMFFYSNRYEATAQAAVMLAGGKDTKLLQEAVDFVAKQPRIPEGVDLGGDLLLPEDSVAPLLSSSLISGSTTDRDGESPPASSFPPPGLGSLRSSAKIGSLATASQDVHTAALRRKENRKLKLVLAELYASCNRNTTIGDVFLDTGSTTVMNGIDHRRFVTFGLVHGLIRRVHNYPLAQRTRSADPVENDDFFLGSTPSRSGGMALSTPAWTESDDNDDDPATEVAAAMDGMACDDELACLFEMTIEELIELVETESNNTVVSLYSTALDNA